MDRALPPEAEPPRPADAGPPRGPTGTGPAARNRRGYWIPALIAMAVLLAIGIAAGAGDLSHPAPRTLPGGALASQIALGVQAQRGLKAPPAVDCPSAEPVRAGWSFRCTVAIGATRQTLDVTEIDSRGTLRWSPATGP